MVVSAKYLFGMVVGVPLLLAVVGTLALLVAWAREREQFDARPLRRIIAKARPDPAVQAMSALRQDQFMG